MNRVEPRQCFPRARNSGNKANCSRAGSLRAINCLSDRIRCRAQIMCKCVGYVVDLMSSKQLFRGLDNPRAGPIGRRRPGRSINRPRLVFMKCLVRRFDTVCKIGSPIPGRPLQTYDAIGHSKRVEEKRRIFMRCCGSHKNGQNGPTLAREMEVSKVQCVADHLPFRIARKSCCANLELDDKDQVLRQQDSIRAFAAARYLVLK